MSLRFRLALIFIGMVFLTLVGTIGISWQELIEEPHDPEAGKENREESMGWRLTEILLRGSGPAVVLALIAWWLAQRMLRPIEALTLATENLEKGQYGQQIPHHGGRDELSRLTAAFNAMSKQVALSFQGIREFTLHASHELKTPLTILRSSFEAKLLETPIGSRERDEMASLLDEVRRLTSIVDSLALLTKADAQLLKNEKLPVDLHALITATREDVEALSHGKELEVMLDRCDEVTVIGDRFRLRQLLLILADNAVKYNEPHGVVSVSLRRFPQHAEICFANSGPGLGAEEQKHVFDRFFRGNESQSREIEGSGLGLSIAKWIVDSHKGSISFHSDPEKTIVSVVLPLEVNPA